MLQKYRSTLAVLKTQSCSFCRILVVHMKAFGWTLQFLWSDDVDPCSKPLLTSCYIQTTMVIAMSNLKMYTEWLRRNLPYIRRKLLTLTYVQVCPWEDSQAETYGGECVIWWSTWKPKTDLYENSEIFSQLMSLYHPLFNQMSNIDDNITGTNNFFSL
jgi:hypothetical protein